MLKKPVSLLFLLLGLGTMLLSCNSNNGDSNTKQATGKDTLANEGHDSVKDRDGDETIEKLKAQLQENENQPDLHLALAKNYYQEGSYQLAQKAVQNAVNIDSSGANYHYWYGKIYWELNYPKGAIKEYKRAIDYDPDYKKAYLELGKAYFYGKKRKQSFRFLNKALRQDELLDEAYLYKGLNYKEMKDTGNAISNLQTAVELNPENKRAHLHLGHLHTGQPEKAVDYYKNVLRVSPRNLPALYGIGLAHQELGNKEKAIEHYEKIVKMKQLHRNANYNLGYLYFLKEDNEKALTHFKRAIKADDQYTEAYLGKGLAHKDLGQEKKAITAFERVLELSPGQMVARENLQVLREE